MRLRAFLPFPRVCHSRPAEDLETLHTLGFRGEALFGCAQMGDLAVHSGGVCVRYDSNGLPTTPEPVASTEHEGPGTMVSVGQLFSRVPVRREMVVERVEQG